MIRLELLSRSRRTSRNGRLALLALGAFAVLLDAGAKYSGWRAAPLAGDEPRADSVSQSRDGSFDINGIAGTTVRAVGDLPRAELQSWPVDSRYDRAVRF